MTHGEAQNPHNPFSCALPRWLSSPHPASLLSYVSYDWMCLRGQWVLCAVHGAAVMSAAAMIQAAACTASSFVGGDLVCLVDAVVFDGWGRQLRV